MNDIVGEVSSYYIYDVHHYYKKSAGNVALRPSWYFDVREQGEGIADVSTHFIDLAMWQCSPDVPVSKERVSAIAGSHYPTVISRDQFATVSGETDFSEFLSPYIRDGRLEVNANGTLQFAIDAIPVKIDIEWRYGNDSTRDIFRQEVKCALAEIMQTQDETTSNIRKMRVRMSGETAEAVSARLSAKYPWVSLSEISDDVFEIVIDASSSPRMISGGTATAGKFLSFLNGEPMPEWESVNTLTKYYITTTAVESLR